MSTESITNFAEQEAAAMKKNKEMFMALWVEYAAVEAGVVKICVVVNVT